MPNKNKQQFVKQKFYGGANMSIFGIKVKENKKTNRIEKQYIKVGNIEILGQWFELKIDYKNINIPEANFNNKDINLILPLKYKNKDIKNIINVVIYKIYEKVANEEAEIIMEKIRAKLKFAPEDYKICLLKNEMAKCIDKEIIINPYIMKYDRETIKYIILHEYCHLKYKTHSKGFWGLVKRVMPEYERYEIAA